MPQRPRYAQIQGEFLKDAPPELEKADGKYWVVMSAEVPPDDERGGDVIRIAGMECEDGIPLLAQHMRTLSDGSPAVIGKVEKTVQSKISWKGQKLPAKLGQICFAETPLAKKYASLWPEFVNKVSVGAFIKEYEPLDPKSPYGGWDIKKSEVFELSVVTIPANPAASVLRTIKETLGFEPESNAEIIAALKELTQSNQRLVERLDRFEANSVTRSDAAEQTGDHKDQQADDFMARLAEHLRSSL